VYSREINGEEYDFGVSGKLIMNVLVMYDRQTGSLWSQLLGKAVQGPLKGTVLEFLPSFQTTWADWKERYPSTVALDIGSGGAFDPYESYYRSGATGVIGETIIDDRLYVKEFVIGVEQNGEAAAYPFSVLNDQPVVHDEIGGVPVLVIFDKETGSGVVYHRELDGQILTFSGGADLKLTDFETGSTWDGLSGTATGGPLAGETLERLKSTQSFWFGWKDFYPDTRLYGIDP